MSQHHDPLDHHQQLRADDDGMPPLAHPAHPAHPAWTPQLTAAWLQAWQEAPQAGTEGQDRESYSDTQDRRNYTCEED